MRELLNIRTVHQQIVRLLTNAEQKDLKTADMFRPFEEVDLLNYGSHTVQKFLAAKKLFEYLLQPAEQRVALKLKKQLSGVDANVRQVGCLPFIACRAVIIVALVAPRIW